MVLGSMWPAQFQSDRNIGSASSEALLLFLAGLAWWTTAPPNTRGGRGGSESKRVSPETRVGKHARPVAHERLQGINTAREKQRKKKILRLG